MSRAKVQDILHYLKRVDPRRQRSNEISKQAKLVIDTNLDLAEIRAKRNEEERIL